MKRWIHASLDTDSLRATKGRKDALKSIDWEIDDQDIRILSEGYRDSSTYMQPIPIRKPIARIEYADGTDKFFVVTYEDGTRSRFGYEEGIDSTPDSQRFYWTYLGRA